MNKKKLVAQGKAMLEMFKAGYLEAYMKENPRLKSRKNAWKKINGDCTEAFGKMFMEIK